MISDVPGIRLQANVSPPIPGTFKSYLLFATSIVDYIFFLVGCLHIGYGGFQ